MSIPFYLKTLTLQCRQSREVVDLSHQVCFFYGRMSVGKSSIARLIDFCFGGSPERSRAMMDELVSVQLNATIGLWDVLIERAASDANRVQATWRNEQGQGMTLEVPIEVPPDAPPIWSNNVSNLSDLTWHWMGFDPLKVQRSKSDPDSPLKRLSFRNIVWYCYLRQDKLDNSFFRLAEPFRLSSSRDVMRFVLGFYSERLNVLQIDLNSVREDRAAKRETARQMREFLREFGYSSEADIRQEIMGAEAAMAKGRLRIDGLRANHAASTRFADSARDQLRELSERLSVEGQTLRDLQEQLQEQESLRAELLTMKFKLAKAGSASSILGGVKFAACPACGSELLSRPAEQCHLCGHSLGAGARSSQEAPQDEMIRRDLTSRILDLDEALNRHRDALGPQAKVVDGLGKEKAVLEARLAEQLRDYDSAFVTAVQEGERELATLTERVRLLEQIIRMPAKVAQLDREADTLVSRENEIKRHIEEEQQKLSGRERFVTAVEKAFLQALVSVGMPGMDEGDVVTINRGTWWPRVLSGGKEDAWWDFTTAESGGKRTLFHVCYALAMHLVAAENGLPLPSFMVIDSPMKNIDTHVEREIFERFYGFLYDLAAGPLRKTQFIIIDQDFVRPQPGDLDVNARLMTRDDPDHPPLISYYRGA